MNMQGIFFNATFLKFLNFFNSAYNYFGKRSHGNLFLFRIYILERTLFCNQKKICDFGTMPYYLWKIVSVEKIWTLVNCIPWCLADHMTIWAKFVNDTGGLLEYLLSAMWSLGRVQGSYTFLGIFFPEFLRKMTVFLWIMGMKNICFSLNIPEKYMFF